jgi:phosphonate transport system substrate-binding protein
LVLLLAMLGSASADVTLGVFPRFPAQTTHSALRPLVTKLSSVLGENVRLVVPKDFATFWQGVAVHEYDIVHYNQYHYIKSAKEFGYRALVANIEENERLMAGALFVREDSNVTSLAELKGSKVTILFGGSEMAMNSYIAPTALLRRAGLEPGVDYSVRFVANPASAVIGVAHGAGAVAGAGSRVPDQDSVRAVTQRGMKVRMLASSESFVHLPWAVTAEMPSAKAQTIQRAMAGLSLENADDAKILKAAGVDGFYVVSDEDFALVREITRFATGEFY